MNYYDDLDFKNIMDFVQKKVTGQGGMRGRGVPPRPLPWIQASVPDGGVRGHVTWLFPEQAAGLWMVPQT